MTGAAFCNVDPAYTCASGGSWWPFVAGVVILAGFAGWRVRRRNRRVGPDHP